MRTHALAPQEWTLLLVAVVGLAVVQASPSRAWLCVTIAACRT